MVHRTNSEKELSLRGLWPENLPEPDYSSAYALELAYLVSFYMDMSSVIKFPRFIKNETWNSLQQPLYLGVAINFLAMWVKKPSVFSHWNAKYLRQTLDSRNFSLGGLVGLPDGEVLDALAATARAYKFIEKVVFGAGLRFVSQSESARIIGTTSVMAGAAESAIGFMREFGESSGDLLGPLR